MIQHDYGRAAVDVNPVLATSGAAKQRQHAHEPQFP